MVGIPVFVMLILVRLWQIDAVNLIEHHKRVFEKSFHDRCDKYPFVQQYVNKLENSDERYLTFVYQEPNLKNGGLGDKIAGLISAVSMALRFNRTLIVRSAQNEMHRVFRPYHPTDIHSKTPKYAWDNFTSWSNFDWKYANRDETEYDLYDCVNNKPPKFGRCSMIDGDIGTPHILYRSNRCHLCYYDLMKDSVANKQMKAMGVNETSNLYEVAGCMMRLAMWPTELLWQEVGKMLSVFERQVTPEVAATARRNRRTLRTSTRRLDDQKLGRTPAVVQIGMHFRCGDKSFAKNGGTDHTCVYNEDDTEENQNGLFPLGNPYSMGVCARRSLNSYLTASLLAGTSSGSISTSSSDSDSASSTSPSSSSTDKTVKASSNAKKTIIEPISKNNEQNRSVRRFLQSLLATASDSSDTHDLDLHEHSGSIAMAFLSSDNEMSSMQMNTTLGLPYSIVSPQGCHVDFDNSKECHTFTVTQWFMLALSDVLVTQEGIPSSFSRYAGIYGLKPEPFRNGKHCGAVESTMELSRKFMHTSNWICHA